MKLGVRTWTRQREDTKACRFSLRTSSAWIPETLHTALVSPLWTLLMFETGCFFNIPY